jgi:ABC-type Co2+ transport system permease subunit
MIFRFCQDLDVPLTGVLVHVTIGTLASCHFEPWSFNMLVSYYVL